MEQQVGPWNVARNVYCVTKTWTCVQHNNYQQNHSVYTIPQTMQMFSFVWTRNPCKVRLPRWHRMRVYLAPMAQSSSAEGQRLFLKVLCRHGACSPQDTPSALRGLWTPTLEVRNEGVWEFGAVVMLIYVDHYSVIDTFSWVVCFNTIMDLCLGSGKSSCMYMYQIIYLFTVYFKKALLHIYAKMKLGLVFSCNMPASVCVVWSNSLLTTF